MTIKEQKRLMGVALRRQAIPFLQTLRVHLVAQREKNLNIVDEVMSAFLSEAAQKGVNNLTI
jgi:hypothetical protein